jgi:hypothetical protein
VRIGYCLLLEGEDCGIGGFEDLWLTIAIFSSDVGRGSGGVNQRGDGQTWTDEITVKLSGCMQSGRPVARRDRLRVVCIPYNQRFSRMKPSLKSFYYAF